MVTECPECGSAVRDGRSCAGCGWVLLRLAAASVISPTERLVQGYQEPPAEERARIAGDAKAMLARLQDRFSIPESPPPLRVAESTEPTCAGCSQAAEAGILRDARLWHTPCWDRLRDRVARARWAR